LTLVVVEDDDKGSEKEKKFVLRLKNEKEWKNMWKCEVENNDFFSLRENVKGK
jgi:hypothetical protein